MSLIDVRTSRVLFTVLLFALALGFLYIARRTLIAFLFAVFFAYLMDPAVSRVEKWVRGRGRAIALIYLLLVALLITFFFFVGPQIAHQAQRLSESLPKLLETVSSGQIAEQIGKEQGWSVSTRVQLSNLLANHRAELLGLAQRMGLRVAEVAQQAWLLIVVPILAAFFLKDGRAFGEVFISFVHSRPQREFLEGVLGDLNQMLAQFIRAQLTLAAFSFVAYLAFLELGGVPYALVLGTAGGMMEFIPVVGPLVAAVLIFSVAMLMSYPALGAAFDFSRGLALGTGLRDFAASNGSKHGVASAGRHLRCAGRGRDRRSAGHLSFHSDHGQLAYRVAALASLCREEAIRAIERIFFWFRNYSANIRTTSRQPPPAVPTWSVVTPDTCQLPVSASVARREAPVL